MEAYYRLITMITLITYKDFPQWVIIIFWPFCISVQYKGVYFVTLNQQHTLSICISSTPAHHPEHTGNQEPQPSNPHFCSKHKHKQSTAAAALDK